jgi:hypothetical protein
MTDSNNRPLGSAQGRPRRRSLPRHAAMTNVYRVMAICTPVTVVSRSWAMFRECNVHRGRVVGVDEHSRGERQQRRHVHRPHGMPRICRPRHPIPWWRAIAPLARLLPAPRSPLIRADLLVQDATSHVARGRVMTSPAASGSRTLRGRSCPRLEASRAFRSPAPLSTRRSAAHPPEPPRTSVGPAQSSWAGR